MLWVNKTELVYAICIVSLTGPIIVLCISQLVNKAVELYSGNCERGIMVGIKRKASFMTCYISEN